MQDESPTKAIAELVYKKAKLELKYMITNAKRNLWKSLLRNLDEDVWGDGFRIAMRHLRKLTPPYNLSIDRKLEIVKELFSTGKNAVRRTKRRVEEAPPFTDDELKSAVAKLKIGKAPGPDHLTAEAVKVVAETTPKLLLDIFNQLMKCQEFPRKWKEATVILLWKGKPMDLATAYRPICLLSVMGKLYERLIKERLETEIEKTGGLSARQFGFVRGRSTVHAIKAVVDKVNESAERWVAVVALDIKNAFNSASWDRIVHELAKRDLPLYLRGMIEAYFSERIIFVSNEISVEMGAGVPQGSVLGPTLWNILYDGILNLELLPGVTSMAYADDLIIIVEAEDQRELMFKTNESIEELVTWMEGHELQVAPHKTEAAIIRGPRKRHNIVFNILGNIVVPKKELKYLGVILSDKLTFGPHVEYIVKRAETSLAALSRVMPNVGGPTCKKREVLYGVIRSQITYACPAWCQIMRTKKYKDTLEGLQRRALLRVASGYRTVSTIAIQVITGVPPLALQMEEQAETFRMKEMQQNPNKQEMGRITLGKWQKFWDEQSEIAVWTKKLIPDLEPWIKCEHRRTDYYLTQFLSGHGHFRTYTKRFKLTTEDLCVYCGGIDSPEHAIFVCSRWERGRSRMSLELGEVINSNSIVRRMIESKSSWNSVHSFIIKVRQGEHRKRAEEGATTEQLNIQAQRLSVLAEYRTPNPRIEGGEM